MDACKTPSLCLRLLIALLVHTCGVLLGVQATTPTPLLLLFPATSRSLSGPRSFWRCRGACGAGLRTHCTSFMARTIR
jgi:hypothetical protein